MVEVFEIRAKAYFKKKIDGPCRTGISSVRNDSNVGRRANEASSLVKAED